MDSLTLVSDKLYKTISDHKATKLYLKIPDVIHKSYQRLIWIYKKGDFVKFNNLISQFDWYKLLSNCTQNINMMCVRFTEKYLEFNQNNLGSDEFSSRKSFELRKKTVALLG
jgi:hypothetical protein